MDRILSAGSILLGIVARDPGRLAAVKQRLGVGIARLEGDVGGSTRWVHDRRELVAEFLAGR